MILGWGKLICERGARSGEWGAGNEEQGFFVLNFKIFYYYGKGDL
jgi:hypothetical protein